MAATGSEECELRDRSEDQLGVATNEKNVCSVKCTVISVGDVDTVKQEFGARIYVGVMWEEPKFQHRRFKDVVKNEHWDPRIYISNAISIVEEERKYFRFKKSGKIFAELRLKLRGTFKTPMKLDNFPFDYQELTINLTSSNRQERIVLKRRQTEDEKIIDNIYTKPFTGEHEWNLQEHVDVTENESEDSSESNVGTSMPNTTQRTQMTTYQTKGTYPTYDIKVHVQRKPSYYMWNVALPVVLILALSFTSFVIDADDPSARLGVTLTMLLTAVAFKFVVSDMLPKVSYLTVLDKWVLSSFVLQCFMVAQNAVTGANWRNEDTRKRVDGISGLVLGSMAILLNIVFIGTGTWKYFAAKRYLTKKTKEYKAKLAESVPDQTQVFSPDVTVLLDTDHVQQDCTRSASSSKPLLCNERLTGKNHWDPQLSDFSGSTP